MIKLKKNDALYQQIANYFEREIVEGRLRAGDRIPATVALARQFEVNADTIQQSLKLLMEQGLVDRKPGRGTYVRRGVNNKAIGIIFGKEIYTDPDVMFFSVFLESLHKIFNANGWDCKLFASSEFAGYDKPFYDMKSAVEAGEIRAVVEFCSNDFARSWLDKSCPVPVPKNSLMVDYCDFTFRGLSYLYDKGCRKPLVLAYEIEDNHLTSAEGVKKFCRDYGFPNEDVIITYCSSHAQPGYDVIKDYFSGNCRPDGVLVANDSAFRGALYALLEMGIKIPDQVKIITYANKGINIFCHLPLTKLEVDPDTFARQTYDDVIARLKGEKTKVKPVVAKLVPGKSCGE